MHEAKKYKAKQKLVKGSFMSEEDNIIDGFQICYRESLMGESKRAYGGKYTAFHVGEVVVIY